jgi:hypothetical protein
MVAKKKFLLIHTKNKYKMVNLANLIHIIFDKFFDSSPLASWGTINTNPILQQLNNNANYLFHVIHGGVLGSGHAELLRRRNN